MTEYFEIRIDDCSEDDGIILQEHIGTITADDGSVINVRRSGLVYYVSKDGGKFSVSLAALITHMGELIVGRIAEEQAKKNELLERGEG